MNQYIPYPSGGHASGLAQAMAQHERLVHWVARRQWLGPLPFGEGLQAGRIALWRALEGFDPSRGTKFSSYAVPAIERNIWRAVAQAKRVPQEVLTPHPPQEWPDLEEGAQRALLREAARRWVARLPRRLAYVIVARYGLAGHSALTFGAIGRRLGVTRQRAHQLHTEAILWLAHPARSLELRRLLDLNTVADYQAYLARLRRWQQKRRMPR